MYTATATPSGAVSLLSFMSLAISKTFDPTSPFKHAALNHTQPSIRIIKVLPSLSPEGFVQCVLTHGNTTDDYTCLSYTWGDESTLYPILVDGQSFFVRQNLHSFLHVVREIYPLRPFWIDAVCIDQGSIAERNHQVAQMGAIYKAAAHVIIWLGNESNIVEFLRVWNRLSRRKRRKDAFNRVTSGDERTRAWAGWDELAKHAYWTRAWITQEIAHSRTLSILSGTVETYDLVQMDKYPSRRFQEACERFWTQIGIALDHRSVLGVPLFSLLQRLPRQECKNPRDRVYSLLGLAAEGADITVDYGSSDLEFCLMLFGKCRALGCLCGTNLVYRILGGVQGLLTEASTDTHSIKLGVQRSSVKVLTWKKPWLLHKRQHINYSIPYRTAEVLTIDMMDLCLEDLGECRLEILGAAGNAMGQQIGRFTFQVRSVGSDRWSVLEREHSRPESGVYYDGENGSWQPVIGTMHQQSLIWYKQSDSTTIVSNWFRVMLRAEEGETMRDYILDVPMQVWMAYAEHSNAFHELTWYPYFIESRRTRNDWDLCSWARTGAGKTFTIQNEATFEDVWLCGDVSNYPELQWRIQTPPKKLKKIKKRKIRSMGWPYWPCER